MRVLVTGSRTYKDRDRVYGSLDALVASLPDGERIAVVHGAARGADTLAEDWATAHRYRFERHPAKWDICDHTHPEVPCPSGTGHRRQRRIVGPSQNTFATFCPLAGPRRNADMLIDGQPHLVLAFLDKPLAKSNGTADMVARAKAAGIPVFVVGVETQEPADAAR